MSFPTERGDGTSYNSDNYGNEPDFHPMEPNEPGPMEDW